MGAAQSGRAFQAFLLNVLVYEAFAFAGINSMPPGRSSSAVSTRRAHSTEGKSDMLSAPRSPAEQPCVGSTMPSLSHWGSAAVSLLAALVVALAPINQAKAASTGRRMGGSVSRRATAPRSRLSQPRRQAPKARPPPPRASAAPRQNFRSNTTVINKTTYVAPPLPPVVIATPAPWLAPPVPFGLGFGPTLGDVVVGAVVGSAFRGAIHSGPSNTDRMLENQQRQDERMIDQQALQIDALKQEIQELKSSRSSKDMAKNTPSAVVLEVKVPVGKEPGQTFLVKAPSGPACEVKVPDGLGAGDTFKVQVPSS